MVEIEQSGYKTRVPFCATNDVDTFHDIGLVESGGPVSELIPGLLVYDKTQGVVFGNGTHQWSISDPACDTDPTLCNAYGFEFDVTCSPFDPPFTLNATPAPNGITHDLTAMGPAPASNFDFRPWVASFEFTYCTSINGANCDVDSPNFEQNAQTRYHYDVVGYPMP
jgi:hypothetical protein